LLLVCNDAAGFEGALEELEYWIIEGILPHQSLRATGDNEKWLPTEYDPRTRLLWEISPDGTRKPARAEIQRVHAHHGDWEHFAPEAVRFWLRGPTNEPIVRLTLTQALRRNRIYWLNRFATRTKVSVHIVPGPSIPISECQSTDLGAMAAEPSVPPDSGAMVPAEPCAPPDSAAMAPTEPCAPPDSGAMAPTEACMPTEDVAARRQAVVYPILRSLGMTVSRWAAKAGVDPSVAYGYVKGTSNPRPENRVALAEVLKAQESDLPL
jgi:hypothetical protein